MTAGPDDAASRGSLPSRAPARLVPIDELVQLVTDAGVQHHRGLYETSLSNLLVRDGDPLADLESAYELAHALGIPDERMAEAIARRYPSVEDQLSALERHHAVATTKAVAKTYEMAILRTLREGLPASTFRAKVSRPTRVVEQPHQAVKWRRDYEVEFFLVTRRERSAPVPRAARNLFGLLGPRQHTEATEDEILLATVEVGYEFVPAHAARISRQHDVSRIYRGDQLYLVVTVGSAVFMKLCAELLEELRERFDKHNGVCGYEVIYDYVVE